MAISGGTEVAIESADIVLMQADLFSVVTAIDLSRAIVGCIKRNLFWALAYNVTALPIAAGAFIWILRTMIPPYVAGLAMALSSVSVVVSSLSLCAYSAPKQLTAEEYLAPSSFIGYFTGGGGSDGDLAAGEETPLLGSPGGASRRSSKTGVLMAVQNSENGTAFEYMDIDQFVDRNRTLNVRSASNAAAYLEYEESPVGKDALKKYCSGGDNLSYGATDGGHFTNVGEMVRQNSYLLDRSGDNTAATAALKPSSPVMAGQRRRSSSGNYASMIDYAGSPVTGRSAETSPKSRIYTRAGYGDV